jgi:magnesium transporter
MLIEMNAADIGELFETLPDQIRVVLFRLLPKELAAEAFSYMDPEIQQRIVEGITDKELARILDELFLDDTVDFIEEMPASMVKRVLKATDADTRKQINQLLQYPEDSAGSLMTIEFMELEQNETVKEAIREIRRQSDDKESINTCFVTDRQRRLEGIVRLHTILASDDETVIGDLMDTDIISVKTHDDQASVAGIFKKYDLLSLPVVDNENRLVGIITIDDIVDVIEEENSEDFYKMAAVMPGDDTYLKSSVVALARARITWLLVLMISATITGNIIRQFESVLSSMVILAAYIPMLMDTGGNSGSQAATMVIRGMALGEIHTQDILKIIFKEFRVSLLVGTVLALVNFAKLMLLDRLALPVALTVCVSLFCTVIVAKFCGSVLPVVAQKCKLDPAIMASPMITTIVDAVSLSIYFGLSSLILHLV